MTKDKPARKLPINQHNRAIAVLWSQDQLVRRGKSDREVIRELEQRYRVTHKTAVGIHRDATRELLRMAQAEMGYRRALHVARLERLYQRALDSSKLAVARSTLRDLARVEGHEAPQRHEFNMPPPAHGDEGDATGRTEEELEYILQHGYYPDEAPLGDTEAEAVLERADAMRALPAEGSKDFPI